MKKAELEAIRQMLRRRTAERTKDSETARAWLIGEGIYDNDGKLLPQYGGSTKPGDSD